MITEVLGGGVGKGGGGDKNKTIHTKQTKIEEPVHAIL